MMVDFANLPSGTDLNPYVSCDGLLTRRTSRTTLARRLLDEAVRSRIFPQQVMLIDYNAFRLTRANLHIILEKIHLVIETVSFTERMDENASVLSISLGFFHHSPNGLVYCVDYYGVPKLEVVTRHFVLHMGEAKRLHATGGGKLVSRLPLQVSPREVADDMFKAFGANVDVNSLKYARIYTLSFPSAHSML